MALDDLHLAHLYASALTDEVIEARGYATVRSVEELVLAIHRHSPTANVYTEVADPASPDDRNRRTPYVSYLGANGAEPRRGKLTPEQHGLFEPHASALLLPVWWGGRVVGHRLRPDKPRAGRPRYEQLTGLPIHLDANPAVWPLVLDPAVPLVVTEGEKKADALAGRGVPAICLTGVWSWLRKVRDEAQQQDVSLPLPEWADVPLAGRRVLVVFDADAEGRNPQVALARVRLTLTLRDRGALVEWVRLAVGPLGEKGIDDHLARGSDWETLAASAREPTTDDLLRHDPQYQRDFLRELRQATARAKVREQREGVRTDWVDVAGIIEAGAQPPEPPSVFEFADGSGRGLLYAGRLNALFGDGGVGKSLLMAALQAEHVQRGEHVVHLEYDNNPDRQVVWRVVAAGADPERVAEYLHVLVGVTAVPSLDFQPGLVTLDSLNAAMSAFDGLEVNASGKGVDTVVRKLVAPFTERGATALWLDHVGHQERERPTNSRRKIQAVQGVMLRAEPVGTPGRVGERWSSRLVVTKDNPGWAAVPVGQVVGFAVVDGRRLDPDTGELRAAGTCRVSLRATPLDVVAPVALSEADRAQRLVLAVVQETPPHATVTRRDVRGSLGDRGEELSDSAVKRALDQLYAAGRIGGEQHGTGRTATWHFYPLSSGNGAAPTSL